MSVSDGEILEELRKEWKKRIEEKKFKTVVKTDGGEKSLISSGLKVRAKGTGIVYTVKSVSSDSIILKEPNGAKKLVNKHEFESDFELE